MKKEYEYKGNKFIVEVDFGVNQYPTTRWIKIQCQTLGGLLITWNPGISSEDFEENTEKIITSYVNACERFFDNEGIKNQKSYTELKELGFD